MKENQRLQEKPVQFQVAAPPQPTKPSASAQYVITFRD